MGRGIPLFRQILGSRFEALAPEIRGLHEAVKRHRLSGLCDVARGSSLRSKLCGFLVGAPKAGRNLPFTIRFRPRRNSERWTFVIGSHETRATFRPAADGREDRLVARFGTFTLLFEITAREGQLLYRSTEIRWLGMRLPGFLTPGVSVQEVAEEGRCRLESTIALASGRRILRVSGWLQVAAAAAQAGERPAERAGPDSDARREPTLEAPRPATADARTVAISRRNERAAPPVARGPDSQAAARPAETGAPTIPNHPADLRRTPEPRPAPAPIPAGASQLHERPAPHEARTIPNRDTGDRHVPPVAPTPELEAGSEARTVPLDRRSGKDDT